MSLGFTITYLGGRCNVGYHNGIFQLCKPGFHVGLFLIKVSISHRDLKGGFVAIWNPIIQRSKKGQLPQTHQVLLETLDSVSNAPLVQLHQ